MNKTFRICKTCLTEFPLRYKNSKQIFCSKSCKSKKQILSNEHKNSLRLSILGKAKTEEQKEKIRNSLKEHVPWNKNKKMSKEFSEKMSKIKKGQKIWSLGKKFSESHKFALKISHKGNKPNDETRQKMRVSHIAYKILHGCKFGNIGKNERHLLDLQEQKDNCKILRQYLIKELGYFVDGYCLETNTIYEVYEPYHNNQVFKDLDRETEICNHLSCDFIILWDK